MPKTPKKAHKSVFRVNENIFTLKTYAKVIGRPLDQHYNLKKLVVLAPIAVLEVSTPKPILNVRPNEVSCVTASRETPGGEETLCTLKPRGYRGVIMGCHCRMFSARRRQADTLGR